VVYEPVSDSDFGIRAAVHILLATTFLVRVCCFVARAGLLARYSAGRRLKGTDPFNGNGFAA
jgi:hypothetical protein